MKPSDIESWLEDQFEYYAGYVEMPEKIRPLLARIWQEGWIACKAEHHEPDSIEPENPYGEPCLEGESR